MSAFSNIDKRTKRLLAVLGVVVVFAIYFTVFRGGGDNPPEPQKQSQPAASNSTSPQDKQLPADPTNPARPGETEGSQQTKVPAKYPGTGPVVVVYNPFRSSETAPAE